MFQLIAQIHMHKDAHQMYMWLRMYVLHNFSAHHELIGRTLAALKNEYLITKLAEKDHFVKDMS